VIARIRWDDDAWYIDDDQNRRLFSFDLPETLFRRYANEGILTRRAAIALKEDTLAKLQATLFDGNQGRVVEFDLDANWIQNISRRLEQPREMRE
jgi:hypothetical protein